MSTIPRICHFIFFAILAGAGVLGCESKKEANPAEEVTVPVTIVISSSISNQLFLPGELQGFYETGIHAKVNGYVKRLMVDIGDKVKTGQLLAELEAPELVSQVTAGFSDFQAREAIYLNTKSRYVRLLKTNLTAGAVSPYDLDLARTSIIADSLSFVAARAKYESLKQLTDYLAILAPFDGVITERNAAPGAFVGPGDQNALPILRLRNESKLRLHVAVPEIHIGEIISGELVQFTVKSYPDELFQGRITRLSQNVAMVTRSEIVEIEIENPEGKLLPGMYAKAVIPISRRKPSLLVPQSSVVTNMERSFVIRTAMNGTEARWVDVRKGEVTGDKVEVFGPLHKGDTVIINATDELKDGSKIKIRGPAQAGSN